MNYLYFYMIMPYFFMIFFIGVFLIFFKIGLKYLKEKNKKQIKGINDSIYYRDIPCFGDINLAYWLLVNFSNIKKNELNNGLFGAYLLKWYKNGYIEIIPSKNAVLKNDNYSIDLKDGNWDKNYVENRIYNFFKEVAGNNNILEKNEIKNYCSVDGNKYKLNNLFKNILNEIQENLTTKEYISVSPSKDYIFFKTQEKITLSEEIIKEYQNLNGLKNFLLDYSNMEEKKHIEVHIWEDYLIFANLFGIADKVKQQFKKIYPDFNIMNTMFDFSFDNTIIGQLNMVYKNFKLQFIISLVVLLLVIILFLDKR